MPDKRCHFKFRTANVAIEDGIITATFNDGKKNVMNTNWLDTPEYREIAKEMGYGDDWRRYAIEHELTHHYFADIMALNHSWSLYENPEQPWPEHVAWEEHCVNALQRYMYVEPRDPYGALESIFGWRIDQVVEDLFDVWEKAK